MLTEFPPLIKHFADTRNLFDRRGRRGGPAQPGRRPVPVAVARQPAHQDLQTLQCPLQALGRASPYLIGALKLILTAPFDIENVPKAGPRRLHQRVADGRPDTERPRQRASSPAPVFSGMLRALEQAWGRDPATMIPDVRYTPNPHDAPGGPLVERGE